MHEPGEAGALERASIYLIRHGETPGNARLQCEAASLRLAHRAPSPRPAALPAELLDPAFNGFTAAQDQPLREVPQPIPVAAGGAEAPPDLRLRDVRRDDPLPLFRDDRPPVVKQRPVVPFDRLRLHPGEDLPQRH